MRTDARANRERIIEVARATLAASPDLSLNAIAKAAGVGPGTLYRHFPTREALIADVYRKEIGDLIALAPALTGSHAPLAAFRLWCERLAEYGRMKHGLADALHSALAERELEETYRPLTAAFAILLDRCRAEGVFRADAQEPEDILLLLGFLWRIKPTPTGIKRSERLLELVIRALMADG